MYQVSVHERNGEPFVLELSDSEITIGRASDNHIVLPRNSVSKRHAKVIAKNGKFIAVDQGSTNGTIVGGQKISAPCVLKAGERMVVGDYVLAFRVTPQAEEPAAAPVAEATSHPAAATEERAAAHERDATSANPAVDAAQGATDDERALELPPMVELPDRRTERVQPISMPDWSGYDLRSTVNPVQSTSTMMLRVPADLFREGRAESDGAVADAAFDVASLWAPELLEAHPAAIAALVDRVSPTDLPSTYPPSEEDLARFRELAGDVVGAQGLKGATATLLQQALVHEATGLGPIEFYLDDPSVRELHVNRFDTIYIRRGAEMERAPLAFGSADLLRAAVARILIGADVADTHGGTVRLPDGTRMELVLPPSAASGPVMSLRKPIRASASMSDLVEAGTLSDGIAKALVIAATHGGSIVIATQRREDATTLLNAIVNEVPRSLRVVTVESALGLSPHSDAVVRLEHTPGAMPTTVARALAIEPEMLAIDPLEEGLAVDWLVGASSRICSTIATLSARSPTDALARLLLLALEGRRTESSAVRRQLAANLDLLVHLRRAGDGGLLVNEVVEVNVSEGGELHTTGVFRSKNGPSGIEFAASGHVPSLFTTLSEAGETFDGSIFNA